VRLFVPPPYKARSAAHNGVRDEGDIDLPAVRMACQGDAGIRRQQREEQRIVCHREHRFARLHMLEGERQVGMSGVSIVDADQAQIVIQAHAAVGQKLDPNVCQMLCDDRRTGEVIAPVVVVAQHGVTAHRRAQILQVAHTGFRIAGRLGHEIAGQQDEVGMQSVRPGDDLGDKRLRHTPGSVQIGELRHPHRRFEARDAHLMACQREMLGLFAALHERGSRQQCAIAQQELPPGEPFGGIGCGQFRMMRLFGGR